jgi:hypothetical protein
LRRRRRKPCALPGRATSSRLGIENGAADTDCKETVNC